jgi:hypothetical protein
MTSASRRNEVIRAWAGIIAAKLTMLDLTVRIT